MTSPRVVVDYDFQVGYNESLDFLLRQVLIMDTPNHLMRGAIGQETP